MKDSDWLTGFALALHCPLWVRMFKQRSDADLFGFMWMKTFVKAIPCVRCPESHPSLGKCCLSSTWWWLISWAVLVLNTCREKQPIREQDRRDVDRYPNGFSSASDTVGGDTQQGLLKAILGCCGGRMVPLLSDVNQSSRGPSILTVSISFG